MSGDPSTLITTLISTTASIVSITGGFLVSRLISLSSEKNGYVAKVAELQKEIDSLQYSIDEIEKRNLESDRDFFFEKAMKEVIENDTSLEDLVSDDDININYRSKEELRPTFDLIHKILDDLNFDDLPELPEDFIKYSIMTNFVYDPHYEYEYSEVYKYFLESTRQRSFFERIMYVNPTTFIRSGKTRSEIEDELENLEVQRNLKGTLLETAKENIQRVGKPEGIVSGLWFIIVSIFIGILYPVSLLVMEVKTYTSELKAGLIFAFITVLIYFSTYLYLLVLSIYTKNNE